MKKLLAVLILALGLTGVAAVGVPQSVFASAGKAYGICNGPNATNEIKNSAGCANKETDENKLEDRIQGALNWLFIIIGGLAVIMVIFGGIQYSISGGESSKTANAKNIITYSVVGLIVALLGSAVVNFVVVNIWK